MLPFYNDPYKSMDKVVSDDLLFSSNCKQMPITSTEVKHDKKDQLNPVIPPFVMNVTPQNDVGVEHCDSKSGTCTNTNDVVDQPAATLPLIGSHHGDTALQEMIKLQSKQTELSSMIAEQQRM